MTLGAFLGEFYAALALDTGGATDHATLARLGAELDSRRPLTIPLPRLRLDDVAVCFHFVVPIEESAGDALLSELRIYQCPVLHSMETDLLSQAHRRHRPFRTVCLTRPEPSEPSDSDGGIAVEIEFPSRLVFQSENRREERQWFLRRRRVRAYLAPTFFFDAQVVVWNLTLKAGSGARGDDHCDWLDELDLITLRRLTDDDADQEFLRIPAERVPGGLRALQGIIFRVGSNDTMLDVSGLLLAVAEIARQRDTAAPIPRTVYPPRATTVELLGWPIGHDRPFLGIADPFEREALCGVVTGILDFNQIDDAEARDTLSSSVPLEGALLRVHRDALVYVREDDRATQAVRGTFGISPYLVIPHAAALCNGWLLMQFEGWQRSGGPSRSVAELTKALEQLEEALSTKWVPNAFFYPTEQALYERLHVETGIAAARAALEEQLPNLKTRLQRGRTRRTRLEASVASGIGAVSAVISLDTLVVDAMPSLQRLVTGLAIFDAKMLGHALTITAGTVVGMTIFFWMRPPAGDHD